MLFLFYNLQDKLYRTRDNYVGTITKYQSSLPAPACNSEGFVTVNLPQGLHRFRAEEESVTTTGIGQTWNGIFNIVDGKSKEYRIIR